MIGPPSTWQKNILPQNSYEFIGFVDEVGFEMYCKILKEVVAEERGEVYEEFREITFKLPVNAYIPDWFEDNKKNKIKI